MIHDWLTCPVCEADGGEITIASDHEHLTLKCERCGTALTEYHGEHDWPGVSEQ
jgi:uncharacterized Zn finger protein